MGDETYLVLVCCSHILDNLLCLGLGDATALSNDLSQNSVDFTGHVGSVTADIEEGLLRKQVADLGGPLLESVLNVNLFGRFSGEGSDQFEFVAKGFLVFLHMAKMMSGWVSTMEEMGGNVPRIQIRT